jgi:RND family efflux transporter MFP subunit
MNYIQKPPAMDVRAESREEPRGRKPGDSITELANPASKVKGLRGGRNLALGALVLLSGALGVGFWQHYELHAQVMSALEQRRDFVPSVRTAPVRASPSTMAVTWPATTEAFEQANIYARASGYISNREVDIGSRVKAGQLLVEITAPELDHQIAQAEGTLAQMQATLQQAKANRDLAKVTWDRDSPLVQKGWVTPQQGDTDRLTLQARDAAVAIAEANITAQNAQLRVLHQQKIYQSVVAPFDGVITLRNIDVGSLVQADATSGTFLFTLMQSDVMRIQLYVPQDEAFGVVPGTAAVVRVPEMPSRDFPGTVTRIADALQPGTRTLLTEIDVPNPDHALSPGVYCTVELKIPRKTPSLIVPSQAIVFNGDGLSVAVVEGGVARIRAVTVVRDFGKSVEVSTGVKDGDQVILNPPVDLVDGRKVQVRPGPPAQLS